MAHPIQWDINHWISSYTCRGGGIHDPGTETKSKEVFAAKIVKYAVRLLWEERVERLLCGQSVTAKSNCYSSVKERASAGSV